MSIAVVERFGPQVCDGCGAGVSFEMNLLRVACVAAISLAACDGGMSPTPDAEPDDTPVRVGFPVSGVRTYANGAMIAVDEVNGRGGLSGRPVELVVREGLEEAAEAVEAAEAMIGGDRVVALIGPNRSSHAIEVGAVAQRHGVPMITTAATNPGVTAAGDLVFMAAFTDQFQGRVMAEFAAGTLGRWIRSRPGEAGREGHGASLPVHLAARRSNTDASARHSA